MPYIKQTWTARVREFANRITLGLVTGSTYDVTQVEGTITTAGSPFSDARMNYMEQGIEDAHPKQGTLTTTNASWVASGDSNLPFKKNVAITGVLAADSPSINFNLATLPIATVSRISLIEAYDGGITIYAASVPTGSITYDYVIVKG